MSTLEVNKITPVSGGTTVQVGESGDTINIPAGATIANAGTATGFGVSLANGADNRVVTASSASALNGEANLTYNGSNLGVNTASPTMIAGTGMHLTSSGSDCRLHISNNTVGDTANDGAYIFMGSDGTLGLLNKENADIKFYANGTERVKIDTNGDIIQGTTSAGSDGRQLRWGSSIHSYRAGTADAYHMVFFNANGEIGRIRTSGSSTAYNTSSDYRLKENEVAISDGIARLKQLKPYRFNFKADADTTVDGFFAHEVSSVVPEAIDGIKDAMTAEVLYVEGDELPEGKSIGDVKTASVPDYQCIDQAKLVPLLVKTIQELEARITELENA